MHSLPAFEAIQIMRQTGSLWLVHMDDSSTGLVPRRVSKNASWPFCIPLPSIQSSFGLNSTDVRWWGGFSCSGDTECTVAPLTAKVSTLSASYWKHTSKPLRYGTHCQGISWCYLHTHAFIHKRYEPCLCLPSRSWSSFDRWNGRLGWASCTQMVYSSEDGHPSKY